MSSQPELKTIKLKSKDKPQDAYYNNSEVFIAFHLEDTKPLDPSKKALFDIPKPLKGCRMFDFNLDKMPRSYQYSFANALKRGNLTVYSKVEGKLISEIKYSSSGTSESVVGKSQLHKYYLPDGTLFFEILKYTEYCPMVSYTRWQMIKRWLKTFLP